MKRILIISLLITSAISSFSYGQTNDLSYRNQDWKVLSENGITTDLIDTIFKNNKAIKLNGKEQAVAIYQLKQFKDFRLEFDVAGRVMSGIGFHMGDPRNYHFIYFRPGYGGTKEAIQYIPIYNGALSWVLYNYPTYEATAEIAPLDWFHVKLEVIAQQLKVYVNDSQEPQMNVGLLDGQNPEGEILLRTMFGESYFANMTIEQLELEESNTNAHLEQEMTFLKDWEISNQFPRSSSVAMEESVKEYKSVKLWQKTKKSHDPFINICRYFENPDGLVFARHTISTSGSGEKSLLFDFIGKLKIMLNGEEIFNYSKYKLERLFDGSYSIILPLEKGENELVFISEGDAFFFGAGFNGLGRLQHQNWGFIARIGDRKRF